MAEKWSQDGEVVVMGREEHHGFFGGEHGGRVEIVGVGREVGFGKFT